MLRTELRTSPRITTRLTIEILGPALNISTGGLCFLSTDFLKEGTQPSLTFNLPDDPSPVVCKARIIWCRPFKTDPELYETGFQFTEISDEDRQRVADFVAAHPDSPAN